VISIFFYPDFTRYALFTEEVLARMYAHIQHWPWQKEAGGEIFSTTPDAAGLIVNSATGPNSRDQRTRNAWIPDTTSADRDRQTEFAMSKHSVDLWHTHPESSPSPSNLDRQTTREYLESFQGDRHRYLMVIIGNRGRPPSMGVWVTTSKRHDDWIRLVEWKRPLGLPESHKNIRSPVPNTPCYAEY
jgi:integrative and conjugative element protein (TIGR02256 family)